jgi:hypothetical protein
MFIIFHKNRDFKKLYIILPKEELFKVLHWGEREEILAKGINCIILDIFELND